MIDNINAIGINAKTRTVDTVGRCSNEDILAMLRAGQLVVLATEEQCRALWGMVIPDPYALGLGLVPKEAEPQPLARICRALEIAEDSNLHRVVRSIKALQEKLATPLDVVLHCPACKLQHIDAPEYPHWRNPPHRTHKCHGCGVQWTPADTNTNGVRAVKPGSSATWPAPDLTLFAADRLPARCSDGFTWHPDIPEIGDEEIITPYLWAIGFDCSFIGMESDAAPEIFDAYSEAGAPDCSAWHPGKPAGDGWLLAAIYDTEDSPHAMYVRPFPAPTPAAATGRTVGQRVEDLAIYGFKAGETLTAAERAEITDYSRTFEECSYSREELEAMTDADLVTCSYWIMAEYAKGQM